jgi:hypothetical protein
MRIATLVLAATAVGVALTMGAALAGKDEPKPSVKFAKTWEKAVEEAKLLNVPLVIHNHGFY